ncbi:MAG: ring-cleaving dioxygenase [Rhodothermales bacterium]
MNPIQGLHHITAVASDPQVNVDFYERVLGQRLVKTTVNFDDPSTYHLYYGDEIGTPGTVLTFFPWLHMGQGKRGVGEAVAVGYRVPLNTLGFWAERLARLGVEIGAVEERFGEQVLALEDPDGMKLELVATAQTAGTRHWKDGPVAEAYALHGFHGVTLCLNAAAQTESLLTEQLGYTQVAEDDNRRRFRAASDAAAFVDLIEEPEGNRGHFGAGSIHHIAFRTVDDDEQLEYQGALRSAGQEVTAVRDRQYFHSIYFREPGGVLFEIATNAPGFTLDEDVGELGTALKLPPWYEARRAQIEKRLPPIVRPRDPSSSDP